MMARTELAIIGVGLIGGSFGLALKSRLGGAIHIRGLCRTQASMDAAVACGAVDEASAELEEVVRDADVIYLSTPVLQIVPMVERLLPFAKAGAVITDAGSTKSYLWETLRPLMPPHVYYVSGHPMTGREKSGVQAADKDLFLNKCYVVLKETTAPKDVFDQVVSLIRLTGANLTTLGVAKHDRCASLISHVPHVAAAALVTLLERNPDDLAASLKLAGGGFKDTTRIASSNADMWADICMTNGEAIEAHLRALQSILGEVADAVHEKDRAAVHAYFAAAKKRRDCILHTTEPMFEI